MAQNSLLSQTEIWLTPEQAAEEMPDVSPRSVMTWAKNGQIPGSFQLPNRRWRIPYSGIVKILGYDPRALRGES
jgi:predicted site-specific integrase-resolvase